MKQPPQQTQQKRRAAKVRLPLWDNARYLAITLVVVGHAILRLIDESNTTYGVYLIIYSFHVPLFVLVSGYFAKADPPGKTQLRKLLTDLVLPYLIFEVIWTFVRWAVVGDLDIDLAKPSWTLWFILSLIVWRAGLPYLAQLRHPLVVSVAVSVAAGYTDAITSEFALSRTLGLLPFFVLGWKLRGSGLTQAWLALSTAQVARWRAGALVVFVSLAVVVFSGIAYWRDIGIRRVLLFDAPYGSIGYSEWWAGGIRLAVIAAACLLVFCFLALVPRRRTFFTDLGQATLYIYLLHSFVIYPFRQSGILTGDAQPWVLPAMMVFAVVVTFLLASWPVRRIFRPLVEPKPTWLLRRVSPVVDRQPRVS